MAGSYYLTSACRTADEFVAAFRRYAEKTMLFVPTQTPLGNGTRARMAIALADGSVMIEGEIEVVGATTRAVGLHGRAGMSVRFIELDDTSRQVLDQLVRARLMSRPVPLPGHLRPRPRAGTVPEPSPELQVERARAASTVPGIGPTSNVNAEAVPAECTLQELPPAVGALGARADLESRFDYSAPAPRDLELHDATRAAGTPARPMTMKGPAPVRMPVARPGGFAVPARAMPGATKPAAPATAPAPATMLAVEPTPAEPEPAEETMPAVETIAEETMPAAEPVPDAEPMTTDDDGGAPIELDLGEPTVSEPPPSPPVPSPPKLPPQPRGRQSMSRTMLGVAPITRAPGPTSARPPAAPGEPTDASAQGGAPTVPATPGEVFGAWWPGGGTDHAETQKMEPMFPDVPALTPHADVPALMPLAGDPPTLHEGAGDDAKDGANDGAGDEAVGALGPWPGAVPARLPPPPRDLVPPVPAPVALAPAFAPTFAQPSPDSGPPPVFEENTSLVGKGRRRPSPIVIASFGGALLLAVIVVVIATSGGSKSGATGGGSSTASGSASGTASDSESGTASGSTAATPAASPDAASTAAAPGASLDAGAPAASLDAGAPPAPPGAIAGATCKAAFTSSPSGADIILGGKVAGTTPRTIAVPCAAASATFKRPRYQPKDVAFTPTADGVTVAAKLERPTFTVRITSTPAGAAVTIDGKVVGRTPLTTRQPGFENTTVTFKKDGYAPATAKLYAKVNGASVKATLKKGGASHHR